MADKDKKDKPISVDDQFLKDFIAKGGKASTDTGRLVDDSNVDTLLDEVADKSDASTPKQAALHKKAVAQGVADTTKEDAAKAQKEQDRNDRLREQELKKQRGKALNVASKVSSTVQDNVTDPLISRAGGVVDKVSSLRTVGGIGLLLAILIFLLFVIVQVNSAGDTRIKQFWYMLNGRATLQGRQQVSTDTSNSVNAKPSLESIGEQDTKAIENWQGPLSQWIESEYRSLFG